MQERFGGKVICVIKGLAGLRLRPKAQETLFVDFTPGNKELKE
ncbi:MAG: hypothetical protein ACYSTL_00075 [Planctomycetota bacterium]|jgi:hypothetical protein